MHELTEQLRFARARVPLYSSGQWRQSLARGDATQLSSWPILDRATVRARGTELLARGLRPGTFYRSSSASTGEPLRIAWNPHGGAWGWANEYRVMLWYGVQPGVRTLLMWGSEHRLQDWVRNTRGFLTTALTPQRLEEAAQYVLQRQPELVMGLPSALVLLARYIRTNYPDAPRPAGAVRQARWRADLSVPARRAAQALSAREPSSSTVAPKSDRSPRNVPAGSMHLLSDNSHIEICRDGEPVPDGEFGDIVATSSEQSRDAAGALPDRRQRCDLTRPVQLRPAVSGAHFAGRACGRPVHDRGRYQGSRLATRRRACRSCWRNTPLGIIRQVLFQQIDPLHWKVLVESGGGFDAALAAQLTELVRTNFGRQCDGGDRARERRAARDFRKIPLLPAAGSAAERPTAADDCVRLTAASTRTV